MKTTIEIVACTADDAVQAEEAGADRIELVAAISEGGLTPSVGALCAAKQRCQIPVVAMLRPRGGGFVYSRNEIATIVQDAKFLRSMGADGLVAGMVTAQGELDVDALRYLVEKSGPTEWVFHRAFDDLRDPQAGLESLIELGFKRILTSGGARTAKEGAERLRTLRAAARGRIEIMPGGGIRAACARSVLAVTDADSLHAGPFHQVKDPLSGAEHLALDKSAVRDLVQTVKSG